MTTVWVVTRMRPFEGQQIVGITASLAAGVELADKSAGAPLEWRLGLKARMAWADRYSVTEWGVTP